MKLYGKSSEGKTNGAPALGPVPGSMGAALPATRTQSSLCSAEYITPGRRRPNRIDASARRPFYRRKRLHRAGSLCLANVTVRQRPCDICMTFYLAELKLNQRDKPSKINHLRRIQIHERRLIMRLECLNPDMFP